jgi:hypothetical protein
VRRNSDCLAAHPTHNSADGAETYRPLRGTAQNLAVLECQIVIAPRAKPPFDYLALDLGPPERSPDLNSVELSHDAEGQTLMNYQSHV